MEGQGEARQGAGLEAGIPPHRCRALVPNGELEKSSPDRTAQVVIRSGLQKHHQLSWGGAVTTVPIMQTLITLLTSVIIVITAYHKAISFIKDVCARYTFFGIYDGGIIGRTPKHWGLFIKKFVFSPGCGSVD